MGATMRLGSQPVHLAPGTRAHEAYGDDRSIASATATATR